MKTQILSEQKGQTLYVYISSEKDYPVLQQDTINQFAREIRSGLNSPTVSYIVVASKNKNFCAGLDINELNALSVKDVAKGVNLGAQVLNEIESSDKICIAAINGFCVGGGFEFAMAFDYIIASDDAKFSLPEVNIGIIPTSDGINRLVRHVGRRRAFEMLIQAKIVKAKEALDLGIINEVASRRKLISRTDEIIKYLDTRNKPAIKKIKELTKKADDGTLTKKDSKAIEDCLATPYARKAISEFLNKNK